MTDTATQPETVSEQPRAGRLLSGPAGVAPLLALLSLAVNPLGMVSIAAFVLCVVALAHPGLSPQGRSATLVALVVSIASTVLALLAIARFFTG